MVTNTGIGVGKPPGSCSGQLQTQLFLLSKIWADDRALPRNQNHEQIEVDAIQLIKPGRLRVLFSSYTWGFFSWGKWDWILLRYNPLSWNTHLEFAGGTFCLIHVAGGQQSSWPPLGALFVTRAWEVHILSFLIRVFRSPALIIPHWQQCEWDEICLVTSTTKPFSGWCWGI